MRDGWGSGRISMSDLCKSIFALTFTRLRFFCVILAQRRTGQTTLNASIRFSAPQKRSPLHTESSKENRCRGTLNPVWRSATRTGYLKRFGRVNISAVWLCSTSVKASQQAPSFINHHGRLWTVSTEINEAEATRVVCLFDQFQ